MSGGVSLLVGKVINDKAGKLYNLYNYRHIALEL